MRIDAKKWDFILLFIILIIVSIIGSKYYFVGTSDHTYPRSFMASDAYHDFLRMEHIDSVGHYNTQAKVLVAFHPAKFTTADGPIMYYTANWIKNLFGIENHVAIHILLVIAFMMEIIIIYLLLLRVNRVFAWLYLPFTLTMLQFPFIAGIDWGLWKSFYAFFIFFILTVFYPFKLTKRCIVGYGITFGALLLTHPFIAPYALILLFLTQFVLSREKIIDRTKNLISICLISGVLFVNYFINYMASSYNPGGEGSFFAQALAVGSKYTLYAADSTIKNFGNWWWLSVLGFMMGLFVLFSNKKKWNTYGYKVMVMFVYIFTLYLIQPVVERMMQFRFTWPLVVSIFMAYLIYNVINSVVKSSEHKKIIAIIGFFVLLVVLNNTHFAFTEQTSSIVSEDLYSSFEWAKENTPEDSTILLLDTLTVKQRVTQHLANRLSRNILNEDFVKMPQLNYDLSKVDTSLYCQIPRWIRNGMKLEENTITDNLCLTKPVPLCSNDYIIVNTQTYNMDLANILRTTFSKLNDTQFKPVYQTKSTMVLENIDSCGSWKPEYILKK